MPPPLNQVFPPAPTFTETNLDSLAGKTCLVTGTTSGVGLELAKMMYAAGGTVFMGARSAERNAQCIETIRSEARSSSAGTMVHLSLDLSNLGSIKASAEEFLQKADRLDVLVHNAGIMTPPAGSKSSLGHDLEMTTNCLGPYLLTHFLAPLMGRTAATAPKDSVRIVWLTSMVAALTPKDGILWEEDGGSPRVLKDQMENYMQSKVGNLFFAREYVDRLGKDGVLSVAVHPGIVRTGLQRNSSFMPDFIAKRLFKDGKFGAYSELFAAFSPEVTAANNGAFIIPWGRFGPVPEHLQKAVMTKEAGGTGNWRRFVEWCEGETTPFR